MMTIVKFQIGTLSMMYVSNKLTISFMFRCLLFILLHELISMTYLTRDRSPVKFWRCIIFFNKPYPKAFHIDFPRQVSSPLVFLKLFHIFETFFRALRENYLFLVLQEEKRGLLSDAQAMKPNVCRRVMVTRAFYILSYGAIKQEHSSWLLDHRRTSPVGE